MSIEPLSELPQPGRITIALGDRRGPEVDIACGAREPDVDNWEAGKTSPTAEQVALLAELTGYPVRFFYVPFSDGERTAVAMVCQRAGRGRGCRVVGPVVYPEPPAQGSLF